MHLAQRNKIYRNHGTINRAIEENVNKISWNVANILHLSKECFFSYPLERKNGTEAAELSCPGTGNITSTLITCQLEKFNLLKSYRYREWANDTSLVKPNNRVLEEFAPFHLVSIYFTCVFTYISRRWKLVSLCFIFSWFYFLLTGQRSDGSVNHHLGKVK